MAIKKMIYNSIKGEINLARLTRLYPAALISMHGEIAEMSLEWIELYGDKVEILSFILVFDFTLAGEDVKDRTVLEFKTQQELQHAMKEVAQFY